MIAPKRCSQTLVPNVGPTYIRSIHYSAPLLTSSALLVRRAALSALAPYSPRSHWQGSTRVLQTLKTDAGTLPNKSAFWTLSALCDVELDTESLQDDPWLKGKSFLIGCVAGIASKTAASPLSRVTILMQTQVVRGAAAEEAGLGLVGMVKKVVSRDGVLGLMRGNTADVLRAAPYTGINFTAYEYYKDLLLEVDPTDSKSISKFAAGGLSGVTGTLLTYPLDLLRTQTAIKTGKVDVSLAQQAKLVVRAGGWASLWAGAGTAVVQKFPQVRPGEWTRACRVFHVLVLSICDTRVQTKPRPFARNLYHNLRTPPPPTAPPAYSSTMYLYYPASFPGPPIIRTMRAPKLSRIPTPKLSAQYTTMVHFPSRV